MICKLTDYFEEKSLIYPSIKESLVIHLKEFMMN